MNNKKIPPIHPGEILKTEFLELKELDFEITDTGFDIDEIGDLFPIADEYNEETEDDVPGISEDIKPFIKQGDIIELGNHRFMCGDSTSKEDVGKMMSGEVADMVFTDPPYNVGYTGGVQFKKGKVLIRC